MSGQVQAPGSGASDKERKEERKVSRKQDKDRAPNRWVIFQRQYAQEERGGWYLVISASATLPLPSHLFTCSEQPQSAPLKCYTRNSESRTEPSSLNECLDKNGLRISMGPAAEKEMSLGEGGEKPPEAPAETGLDRIQVTNTGQALETA